MPHVPFVAFHADEPAARAAARRRRRRIIVGVLVAVGLVPATLLAFAAVLTICGISGCSGGGFGRSTDPSGTQALLVATGVSAAFPLGCYAAWTRDPRLLLKALGVAVVVTVTVTLAVGANVDGCPRTISAQTCAQDAR